jgi:hypothetical protein
MMQDREETGSMTVLIDETERREVEERRRSLFEMQPTRPKQRESQS